MLFCNYVNITKADIDFESLNESCLIYFDKFSTLLKDYPFTTIEIDWELIQKYSSLFKYYTVMIANCVPIEIQQTIRYNQLQSQSYPNNDHFTINSIKKLITFAEFKYKWI